jgi:hypothetical protein
MLLVKHVTYKGQNYQIEITRNRVTVTEYDDHEVTGGLIAALLRDNGRVPVERTWYITPQVDQEQVILACGWKFSKARAWRDEWDYLYRRAGGKDSGYGGCMVKVIK